ncbi:hypothetical protein PSY30_23645, partial [Shigella flexneri]|nr:hypothetical protein [Shigella flexneri]
SKKVLKRKDKKGLKRNLPPKSVDNHAQTKRTDHVKLELQYLKTIRSFFNRYAYVLNSPTDSLPLPRSLSRYAPAV